MIWWKVHWKAFQGLSDKQKIQIHKFIHHRMATNNREHLYNRRDNAKCPDCEENETLEHLIQCNSSNRTSFKSQCSWTYNLQAVSTKHKAPAEMHTAFIAGIIAWLENAPPPNIDQLIPNSSRHLIRTFQEQTKIGWFQIFHGRLASSWASFINHAIQEDDKANSQDTKFASAETWGTQIILVIWRHILQLWTARNKSEHGDDVTSQKLIRKRK